MTVTPQSLRQTAKAFTRPIFAEMAKTGDARAPMELFKKSGILATKNARCNPTLADVFDDGWSVLSENYRNEYVYKNELANRLIFKRHKPHTTGFQVEFNVGHSIVDVAVANGTSTAYEIKTEFDTARRLQSQTTDYLRAFDNVFVVTHPNHVERYEHELDPRVGLIVLTAGGTLTTCRKAESNIENVDSSIIFRCLRREEYMAAVARIFGAQPPLPNGLISRHYEKFFRTMPSEIAHKIFVDAIRSRTTNKNTVDFVKQLPSSLKALGYATPLSGRQRERVTELLSRQVKS